MRTFINRILNYLNPASMFRKEKAETIDLRFMHGINRISIFMFLICIVIMLFKFVF